MKFYEILKELKKGFVFTITDYDEYDNTGGACSYSQRYEKLENGKWKQSFHTSSRNYYCEYCGTFQNGECSCSGEYEEMSSEDTARVLDYSWNHDPNCEIRIK